MSLTAALRHPARIVLRALCRVLFRIRLTGDPRSLQAGRLLVVANHQSFVDGLLLGLFLPIEPVFVVHTTIERSVWFRAILSLVDYLAVDPTNPMAMKRVIRLIESGRPVVIFPEGRITTTGSLMKVYDGPAFVAARTGATIVPVRVDGAARTYFSRMKGRYPRHPLPRITLALQPPARIAMPAGGKARERRRHAGEAMRRIMQEMMFASRPDRTLFEALVDAVALHGRKRPVVEDIKQIPYTYGDLLNMALMLGRLACRHSRAGERVALMLPNLAPTLGLIFGLNAFGRTPALLNYTAGSDGLLAACRAATVTTLVTSRAFVEQARLGDKLAALAGSETLTVVYLEDLREQITLADKLWLMAWARHVPRLVADRVSPEAAAVVLFTSGSEGTPKGVVLSHRALLANVAQIRSVVDFSVEDRILNALPLFHSFGLTAGALLPVLSGADVFLYPSPLHYRVIPELAYDRGCTVLLGTSTFLGNYARFAHPYDFHRLRYVIAGAEKLSEPVRQVWMEKFGLRILEGYGATETAPVLAVNTPMACRFGTVGQLLPGIEARLVPVPGIEHGGILHVRGPNLMSGYLRAEAPGQLQPPASGLGAGWYETGDVVTIDPDGFLAIVGRVKRFAKIAGEMVSLESVEKLAFAAAPAAQHAVSTQPDPARGEALVLFTTEPGLNRERLQQAAREGGWPELAVPRKIVSVAALPVLGTGKTDYVTLKSMAEAT